jgi:hypothetical protein
VKVCVWCAVNARRIVGPVFLTKQFIAKDMYRSFSAIISRVNRSRKTVGWFQQDSATAHTARMSTQSLSDVFGDRIISSGIWAARSPDLNPCDFFFWGSLKDKVYNSHPRTEEELRENIRKKIANIPAEWLQRVNQNLFGAVRGKSTCRGAAFLTPPVICEF